MHDVQAVVVEHLFVFRRDLRFKLHNLVHFLRQLLLVVVYLSGSCLELTPYFLIICLMFVLRVHEFTLELRESHLGVVQIFLLLFDLVVQSLIILDQLRDPVLHRALLVQHDAFQFDEASV